MKVIAGLGNPGKQYEKTYHNVGFLALDMLAKELGVKFSLKNKLLGEVAEGSINGEKIILLKPQTYMNNSGESIRAVLNFFKVELKNLLVIYDDLDIDAGNVRFRKSGSAGTHNGMRSILSHIGSGEFARARIGTKPDNKSIPIIDYVLSTITPDRMNVIIPSIEKAVQISKDFACGLDSEKIMCKYNGNN